MKVCDVCGVETERFKMVEVAGKIIMEEHDFTPSEDESNLRAIQAWRDVLETHLGAPE